MIILIKNSFFGEEIDFRFQNGIFNIPGMKGYNLVKIGTSTPKCFGTCWYVLSVFLPLGGFYRKYVDSLCIYKKFKIRKLISTRYNLLEPQYIQKYQPLMPKN